MRLLSKSRFLVVFWLFAATGVFLSSTTYSSVEAKESVARFSVYFHKSVPSGSTENCERVFPLARVAPPTRALARAALIALFSGPTPNEKEQGYYSPFSSRSEGILKNIRIIKRTAYVDLHDIRPILPGVSSSCESTEFLTEVETTLRQFSSIKRVVFAIEGKPRDFYEWIQADCNKGNNQCDPKPFLNRKK